MASPQRPTSKNPESEEPRIIAAMERRTINAVAEQCIHDGVAATSREEHAR
jgi:hypothetical protein